MPTFTERSPTPCLTDNLPFIAPDPRQTRTGYQYWQMRQEQERRPFQPWDVALSHLRAHRFKTQSDFAAYFKKAPRWATEFKALVIRQKVMTLEEWKACFPKKGGKGRPIESPLTYDEELERAKPPKEIVPLEDEWSGFVASDACGFCPDFTDTSLKAHNGPGGVSWEHDGSFQRSTSEKRWPCSMHPG